MAANASVDVVSARPVKGLTFFILMALACPLKTRRRWRVQGDFQKIRFGDFILIHPHCSSAIIRRSKCFFGTNFPPQLPSRAPIFFYTAGEPYGASTALKNRREVLVTSKPSARSWLPLGTTALVSSVHRDRGDARDRKSTRLNSS